MQEFIVKRTDNKDLKFTGELLAGVESSANNAHPNYSNSLGRWTELNLYKTKGGKFICQQINYTQWQGCRNEFNATTCENEEAIFDFFGGDWLAKQLYKSAGLDISEVID